MVEAQHVGERQIIKEMVEVMVLPMGRGNRGGRLAVEDRVELWPPFRFACASASDVARLPGPEPTPVNEARIPSALSEGPLRQSELRRRVEMSKNGLYQIVQRMTREGLVTRQQVLRDGRRDFTYEVSLTEAGRRAARRERTGD